MYEYINASAITTNFTYEDIHRTYLNADEDDTPNSWISVSTALIESIKKFIDKTKKETKVDKLEGFIREITVEMHEDFEGKYIIILNLLIFFFF